MWWGYRHINGSYQVKRWWGDSLTSESMGEAYESPFVEFVCQPFEARGRQQALERCRTIITTQEAT
jgi:hypothetical protein